MWLSTERGRSANTLAAYRRDLRRYHGWLRERGRRRSDGRPHGDRRLRRSPTIVRRGTVERGAPDRRRPHAAPVPRQRGTPSRRPDRPGRRGEGAVRHPQAADRGAGDTAARRGGGGRSVGVPRSGDARAAVRHRGTDLGRWSAPRSATSTSTMRSSACSARATRSGSCRSGRPPRPRSTSGSLRPAGHDSRPIGGSDAAMPKRSS